MYIRHIICILLFPVLLLVGCSGKENINMQSAKLLFAAGETSFYCILEVTSDGKLIATKGDARIFPFFYGNVEEKEVLEAINTKQRIKKLSKKDMEEIDLLITKIKEKKEKVVPSFASMSWISIIIDGKQYDDYYFNPYHEDVANDFQKFAYKLVDISPIKFPDVYHKYDFFKE